MDANQPLPAAVASPQPCERDPRIDPQPGDIWYDSEAVMYRRVLRRIGTLRVEYESVIDVDDPDRGFSFQDYVQPWSWGETTRGCVLVSLQGVRLNAAAGKG